MRRMSRLTITSLLFAALLSAPIAFAQDAAKLVPAGAAVFIEINDLASLRKDWAGDPLAKFLRDNLPMTRDEGFEQVQKVMGMSGDEIIDRYLGNTVALVVMQPGEQDPAMVISKVTDADIATAIEKLQLKQVDTFGPNKSFRGFTTEDKSSHIAFGNGWAVVSQPKYSSAVRGVIEGQTKTLADQASFKEWTGKLPAGKRSGTVFIQIAEDQVHVLGGYRKDRDVTLHYRGKSPELAQLVSHVSDGKTLDFGPLPASTISVITANFRAPDSPQSKQLDRFFPGKKFSRDILPNLGAPAVFFLGEVPGEKITPNPGVAIPVAGFALKLKDAKVADDLTQSINSLMVVANFAAAKWEVPMVEVKEMKHAGSTFRAANIGAALAQRAGRDEFKPITLSYGRVGDWYIVCTQDTFFTQCIDAAADNSLAFAGSKAVTGMPLKEHEGAVVTAVLRPDALSAHIATWLAHWKEVRPEVVKASHETQPPTPEAQLVRGARVLSGLLDHYQSMTLQAYRDGEGLAAQADIIRKPQ